MDLLLPLTFIADIEIDLSLVRSRITDLRMASMNIATEFLAALCGVNPRSGHRPRHDPR
jgi:hypothetical protein